MSDLLATPVKPLTAHSALIGTSFDRVCDPIEKIVLDMGYEVRRETARMEVDIPLGQVIFDADGAQTRVQFSSPTPPQLQMLKDLYARRFESLGLAAGIRWAKEQQGGMPLNQVGCTIADVTRLSPGFTRLRLQGAFSMFVQSGAGLHFRFLLGPEGAAMPSLDENGLTFWPGGQEAWHRPVFTVRQLGKDADWMDVDIALHDGGRTTQWVAAVQPGDQVALSGPSGSKLPTAERLVLLGDETAMPVMMNIMDNMPKTTEITAALALRHPDDMQDPRRSDIAVAHCDMADEDALLTKLAQHLETDRGAYVFFAAEKTQAARAREMIKAAGWPASAARAAGYWGK